MNFKSVRNLVDDVRSWSKRIDCDFDYIVGIPESGMLVAQLLSVFMHKPLGQVDCLGVGLLVDDSYLSGKTMAKWEQVFPGCKRGALYVKPGREGRLDTFGQPLAPPRIFEWNLFKSAHLRKCMMDIDGILCRDPTKHECDYGPRMKAFYETVEPKAIPAQTVGWLVTCRLEEYRPETDGWLARNWIMRGSLVMRESRTQGHGVFKAGIYKDSGAVLFIESDPRQAGVIAKISGKPVLCYETMEMLA